MKIEIIHFLEIFLCSIVFYIEIGLLNKITSFKGKAVLSIKKAIGNTLKEALEPRKYILEILVFIFIAVISSWLIVKDGKIQQVLLLFAIADLLINQRFTSLAHLSNTILICVFLGLNGYAPISLLFVQLIFFILYALKKSNSLKIVSIASQLVFFLSCLNSFGYLSEGLLFSKIAIFLGFPIVYLIVQHFIRSTPDLRPIKLDNIMWVMVMLGSLKGFI